MRAWSWGLLGLLIGLTFSADALRIVSPPTFSTWDSNAFAQLNDVLQQLWNVSNGRMQLDRVTADPDGVRPCAGGVGEQVFYDTGTDQLCICAVEATRKWNCVNLS